MVVFKDEQGRDLGGEPDWGAWKSLRTVEEGDDVAMVCRKYTERELAAMAERERERRVAEQAPIALSLMVCAANLPDEQALQVEALYPDWSPDASYEAGDVRRYADELWRCRQAHRAQPTWTPDQAHSLWGRIVPPGEIEEWRQPVPGEFDGYTQGQKVTHNGKTWESTFAGLNVWEPGAVGTETLWKEVL